MTRSQWVLPEVDFGACTRCGYCVTRCPEDAVALGEEGPVFVRPEACSYCGICESVCPEDAIRLAYTIGWDTGRSDLSDGSQA